MSKQNEEPNSANQGSATYFINVCSSFLNWFRFFYFLPFCEAKRCSWIFIADDIPRKLPNIFVTENRLSFYLSIKSRLFYFCISSYLETNAINSKFKLNWNRRHRGSSRKVLTWSYISNQSMVLIHDSNLTPWNVLETKHTRNFFIDLHYIHEKFTIKLNVLLF